MLAGLPVARADYIAEVKEGGTNGYMYIGKGAIKRQGLSGWLAGDLIVRDDKSVMYFTQRRRPGRNPSGLPPVDIEEELANMRVELESSDSISPGAEELEETDFPEYDTRVVPYGMVGARRNQIKSRVVPLRDQTAAHLNDPMAEARERRGMLRYIATIDAFCSGQPSWTNTGETAVIAGRNCTKYRLWLAPIFKMEVWVTEELGPGYTGGRMFGKVFGIPRGGVRPLEVLHKIPGFPLKMKGEFRNVLGRGTMKIDYEVLRLIETDLDEKEFEPRVGCRLRTGKLPGWGD